MKGYNTKKEKTSEFYTGAGYLKPGYFEKFGYIYAEMVDFLPDEFEKIIDLGCGPGFFAKVLIEKHPYADYMGIDFSFNMISHSKKLMPELNFIVGNLKDIEIHRLYKPEYVYVCMETLEHVEADIEIIKSIPKSALLLFSVPNYNSKAHVRYFNNEDEIIKRYSELLIVENSKTVHTSITQKIFMFKSRRK